MDLQPYEYWCHVLEKHQEIKELRATKDHLCASILSLKFRRVYLKFRGTLSLLIQIIKAKNKNG